MAQTGISIAKITREPLGDVAYARLREAIKSGVYRPNQRVRESDVADWLKMSRTPVREALQRLELEGLISHESRRGLVISSLDQQSTIELYVMREALEGTAARLAARHASDPEVGALERLLEEQAALGQDVEALGEHNRTFHHTLYSGAHNRYLLKALNSLRDAMMLLGRTTFAVPNRPASALAEHRAIVTAIVRRDAEAAEAAARKHIQVALQCRFVLQAADDAASSERRTFVKRR